MRGCRVFVACALVAVAARQAHAQAAPTPANLSAAESAIACAPSEGIAPSPGAGLRVVGPQDTIPFRLYGNDDLVIIGGGSQTGIQVNQTYFVRRPFYFGAPQRPGERRQTIHTAGWLRVLAVSDTTAVAQVQASCDAAFAGDYLEPFVAPAAIADGTPGTAGTLDFSALARVKSGDEERRIAATGDFVLVDAGDVPLAVGSRVAIYRDVGIAGLPLVALGEGVVAALTSGTPIVRITSARDAVEAGDFIVRRR